MIYIQKLGYEERAVWGLCPVCGAAPGQPCSPIMGIPIAPEFGAIGTHAARLFNAPKEAAINNDQGD